MATKADPSDGTAVWLRRGTKARLEAAKLIPDETISSVVDRLLDEHDLLHPKPTAPSVEVPA